MEGEIRTAHGLCTSFEAKFKSSTASLSDGAQYTQLATLQVSICMVLTIMVLKVCIGDRYECEETNG